MINREVIEKLKDFETMFHATGDLIWAMDLNGNCIYCNSAIKKIRGYNPEEIIGKSILEDLHPEETDKIKIMFQQVLKMIKTEGTLPTQKLRTRQLCKDGKTIWLDVAVDYYCDKNQHMELFFGISRDITELVEAEEETQKLIIQLQKALNEVQLLQGLLPICSSCKKVKESNGYWTAIDEYLSTHKLIDVSHGLCDECLLKVYPQFGSAILAEKAKSD